MPLPQFGMADQQRAKIDFRPFREHLFVVGARQERANQKDQEDEPRQSKFDVTYWAEAPSLVLHAHGEAGLTSAEGETHAAPVFPRSRPPRAR